MDRRSFIRTLAAAGVAATTYPAISGRQPQDRRESVVSFYGWRQVSGGIVIEGDPIAPDNRAEAIAILERKMERCREDMRRQLNERLFA